MGLTSELKARLGAERYALLQSVSVNFQRSALDAREYYDVALDILEGDAASLLALVDRLPDRRKRESVHAAHRAAASPSVAPAAPAAPAAEPRRVDGQMPAPADAIPATPPAAAHEDDHLCPVCIDAVPRARCEPCGHALCAACLDLWRRAVAGDDRRAAPTCPMCRAEVRGFAVVEGPEDPERLDWAGAESNGAECRAGAASNAASNATLDAASDASSRGDGAKKLSRGARARAKRAAAKSKTSRDGDGDGEFHDGPRDYRPYGDSWDGAGDLDVRRRVDSRRSVPVPVPDATRDPAPVVVWFRQDLRATDNPALHAAASSGAPVVPVFVWAPEEDGAWPLGGASRVWLHHALACLSDRLRERYGVDLTFRVADARTGGSAGALLGVARECGASRVYCNRVYEPWKMMRDADVERRVEAAGVRYRSFNASVLYEPWDAKPDADDDACRRSGYGSVRFFLRACEPLGEPPPPLPAPRVIRAPPVGRRPASVALASLGLATPPIKKGRPVDWSAGIRRTWRFGERGASAALEAFLDDGLTRFDRKKPTASWLTDASSNPGGGEDGPKAAAERHRADDERATARISPYMRHGELSPREVYHSAKARGEAGVGDGARLASRKSAARSARTFLRRLAWRDLAYWSLWRFPRLPDEPLRRQYAHQWWSLPWDPETRGDSVARAIGVTRRRWDARIPAADDARLRAWQRGETGYPLVDAAMRELWITGYIPNYMRHVVAGFLIEFLGVDWRHGQLWFHDTLVDADVAIQAFMWQNGGHSGMDQWNFVMHPVYAAKTADPEGDYVRRWLPELAGLPREYVHCPWEAPATALARANVSLGRTYPRRIVVDLDAAQKRSLDAVLDVRRGVGARYVLPDGNEWLPLPEPGRSARCITRVDYRAMTGEVMTRQTAAAPWDKSRRARRDPMSRALDEAAAESERRATSAARTVG